MSENVYPTVGSTKIYPSVSAHVTEALAICLLRKVAEDMLVVRV